jgi:hypothetical protein
MDESTADPAPPWSRSPLVPLAALWAILWILVSIIETAPYIHSPGVPRWQPLVLILTPASAALAWLAFELRSARYLRCPLEPMRPWIVHQLRRLPLLAFAYITVVFGVRHAAFSLMGASYAHLPWQALIPYELVKASIFYGLWLGLLYGTLSLLRSRQQSIQLGLIQTALIESQLARLRAQLRPHFLFNTLNTVSSLMQIDIERADRVLTQLADLLRASLGAADVDAVPLREEIRLLRLYAQIMEERYSGRVVMDWRVSEAAYEVRVPAMFLQPFLENAFKYGVEQTTGIQTIRLAATVSHGELRIEIRNTGSALDPEWREGIGIANCRERLRACYGGRASIDMVNESDGVSAILSLPAIAPGAPGAPGAASAASAADAVGR